MIDFFSLEPKDLGDHHSAVSGQAKNQNLRTACGSQRISRGARGVEYVQNIVASVQNVFEYKLIMADFSNSSTQAKHLRSVSARLHA